MCYALAFCPGNLDTSLGTLACGVNVALVVKAHVPLLKKSLDGRVVDAIISALVPSLGGKARVCAIRWMFVLKACHCIWGSWSRC